jgi:hypothetical protein
MTDLFPTNLSTTAPQPVTACVLCGATPAATASFHQHSGMLLAMRSETFTGPFCRDCGLYAFRRATAHTLVRGWWGRASLFVAPIFIIQNVIRRRKVARLASPMPSADGRRPQNPGRSLWRRPAIIGAIVPFLPFLVIFGGAVVVALTDDSDPLVGKCLAAGAYVSCSDDHNQEVIGVVAPSGTCPPDVFPTRRSPLPDGRVLCLADRPLGRKS